MPVSLSSAGGRCERGGREERAHEWQRDGRVISLGSFVDGTNSWRRLTWWSWLWAAAWDRVRIILPSNDDVGDDNDNKSPGRAPFGAPRPHINNGRRPRPLVAAAALVASGRPGLAAPASY
jgi:hypothetical protein